MAEQPPLPDRGSEVDRLSPPARPRWVKVSLIVVAVLVLGFIVLAATGVGGGHGPGRHLPGGAPGGHMPRH